MWRLWRPGMGVGQTPALAATMPTCGRSGRRSASSTWRTSTSWGGRWRGRASTTAPTTWSASRSSPGRSGHRRVAGCTYSNALGFVGEQLQTPRPAVWLLQPDVCPPPRPTPLPPHPPLVGTPGCWRRHAPPFYIWFCSPLASHGCRVPVHTLNCFKKTVFKGKWFSVAPCFSQQREMRPLPQKEKRCAVLLSASVRFYPHPCLPFDPDLSRSRSRCASPPKSGGGSHSRCT